MDIQKRSTGFGAAIIVLAILLRLVDAAPTYAQRAEPGAGSIVRLPVSALSAPTVAATVPTTLASAPPTTAAPPTTLTQPTLPPVVEPGLLFTAADLDYVNLRVASDCAYSPDLEGLLQLPLSWDLCSGEPAVLIYHSHACECYTKEAGQVYAELVNCRTTDPEYNMVAVGAQLASMLEAAGITVIQDRQLHDEPSYNNAYHSSRASVEDYLQQYPSIRLVLDLHRDAATNSDGSRYATAATVDGEAAAQLMFVVGTDYTGSYHPNWQENLALALKMQVLLERLSPGITRPITLRGSRFNQDMSAGALIIEVGASGNTLSQALQAVPVLAQAIIELQNGANIP